jgi:hypothetical protein
MSFSGSAGKFLLSAFRRERTPTVCFLFALNVPRRALFALLSGTGDGFFDLRLFLLWVNIWIFGVCQMSAKRAFCSNEFLGGF